MRLLRAWLAVVALVVPLVLRPTGAGATEASPGARDARAQNSKDLTLAVEVGLAGVVPTGGNVPLRLELTSTRARRVMVVVSWASGQRTFLTELGATAPTRVDITVPSVSSVDVTVQKPNGGEFLLTRNITMTPDPGRTVVALGKALFSQGAPKTAATIGGIQEAALVELNQDLLNRPGALEMVSGIVLSAADVDSLDDPTRAALREWVWTGGDLALDYAPSSPLPLVDLPATGSDAAGPVAVGAGWVRFTNGAAASGAWSTVLEPAVIRMQSQFRDDIGMWANAGMGGDIMAAGGGPLIVRPGIDPLAQQSLIAVRFLPSWLVALAVFGTALAAGPLAWLLLRTRERRKLMWFAAPGVSLAVAALLLLSGQGVFSSARVQTSGGLLSSPWASSGVLFSGLDRSTTLDLPAGVDLIAANPEALVDTAGGARVVRIKLPRNGFGLVGVGPIKLDRAPRIEVVATAKTDGLVSVAVTNHSKATLTDVSVLGGTRVRGFEDVPPGRTVTLDFKVSSDLRIFRPLFPTNSDFASTDSLMRTLLSSPPESRGLIQIVATATGDLKAGSLSGPGIVRLSATVPVNPVPDGEGGATAAPRGPAETAALRIDEVGGWTNEQRAWYRDRETNGFDMNVLLDDPPGLPDATAAISSTTIVGDVSDGGSGEDPSAEPLDEYVRFTFPRGRASAACGVSLFGPEVQYWDGTTWVTPEKVGEPYDNDRLLNVVDEPHGMQDWLFPAVPPGGRLYVRISGRTFFGPPAMLFDCGERP